MLGFRADEAGNTLKEAVLLGLTSPAIADGIVGFEDVDWFAVDAKGDIRVDGQPFSTEQFTRGSNLHMLIKLMDAQGLVLASVTADYNTGLASLSTRLTPGRYYISVSGTGREGVFPSYSSLGQYRLTVTGTPSAAGASSTTPFVAITEPSTSSTASTAASTPGLIVSTATKAALANNISTLAPATNMSTLAPATSSDATTAVQLPCSCPSSTVVKSQARNKKWRVRFRTSCSAYRFRACLKYDPASLMAVLLQLEHKTGGSYVVQTRVEGVHGVACLSWKAETPATRFKSKWRYRVVNPALLKYTLSYQRVRIRSQDCS